MDVRIHVDKVFPISGAIPIYVADIDLDFVVREDRFGDVDVRLDVHPGFLTGHAFYDRGTAWEEITPAELDNVFPALKAAIESDEEIRERAFLGYRERGGKREEAEDLKERQHMDKFTSWGIRPAKQAAMATLHRLAGLMRAAENKAKTEDPLEADRKIIEDRAAQDANAVIDNPTNQRVLADQYGKSDISKGLDRESEFYTTLKTYADDNFNKSAPHIQPVLAKYGEEDRRGLSGAYHKAFEDEFYKKIQQVWETLHVPAPAENPVPTPVLTAAAALDTEYLPETRVTWAPAGSTLTETGKVLNFIHALDDQGGLYRLEDDNGQIQFQPADRVRRLN